MFSFGLNGIVTHWVSTPNASGGFTYGSPSTLSARWEDKTERFTTAEGETAFSTAVVYLSGDVSINDYLVQGESTVGDPSSLTGAHRVQAFRKMPDISQTQHERKAWL